MKSRWVVFRIWSGEMRRKDGKDCEDAYFRMDTMGWITALYSEYGSYTYGQMGPAFWSCICIVHYVNTYS
jgi:hypothetical protein